MNVEYEKLIMEEYCTESRFRPLYRYYVNPIRSDFLLKINSWKDTIQNLI